MKQIAEVIAEFASIIRIRLAELATGVTVIEAVAANQFESDLRALTATERQRETARDAARLVAALGLDDTAQIESALMNVMRENMGLPPRPATSGIPSTDKEKPT